MANSEMAGIGPDPAAPKPAPKGNPDEIRVNVVMDKQGNVRYDRMRDTTQENVRAFVGPANWARMVSGGGPQAQAGPSGESAIHFDANMVALAYKMIGGLLVKGFAARGFELDAAEMARITDDEIREWGPLTQRVADRYLPAVMSAHGDLIMLGGTLAFAFMAKLEAVQTAQERINRNRAA